MRKSQKKPRIPRSIRTKVLLRCEGKCEKCGEKLGDLVPDIHHIDGNPRNNDPTNLIVLCPNCHRKMERSPETLTRTPTLLTSAFVGEKFDLPRFQTYLKALDGIEGSETRYKLIERIRHQTTDLPLDGMPYDVREAVIQLLLILKKEIRNEKMRRLCLAILHIINGRRDNEVNTKIKELFLSWIEKNYQDFTIEERHHAMDIRQRLSKHNPQLIKELMLNSINKWSPDEFEKLYKEIEFDRLAKSHINELKSLLWKLRDEASKKQLNERLQRIDKLLSLYVFR